MLSYNSAKIIKIGQYLTVTDKYRLPIFTYHCQDVVCFSSFLPSSVCTHLSCCAQFYYRHMQQSYVITATENNYCYKNWLRFSQSCSWI